MPSPICKKCGNRFSVPTENRSRKLCDECQVKTCKACSVQFTVDFKQRARRYCDECMVERTCLFEGCDLPVTSPNGVPQGIYCGAHYSRHRRQQKMDSPIRPLAPKGTGWIDAYGYRRISVDGERIMEHRFVMEELIGRSLLPNENVHHINGVRDDNRPENLELWTVKQPPGQRVEDLLSWAEELINQYGGKVVWLDGL